MPPAPGVTSTVTGTGSSLSSSWPGEPRGTVLPMPVGGPLSALQGGLTGRPGLQVVTVPRSESCGPGRLRLWPLRTLLTGSMVASSFKRPKLDLQNKCRQPQAEPLASPV
jgi:hypothetical protein